jgi:FkbM family methyltransferase
VIQRFLSFRHLFPVISILSMVRLVWAKINGKASVTLRVRGLQVPILARLNNSDLPVLYQVFGERECEVDVNDPALIIDGGANVGYSTLFFSLRYPNAKIVAVEPSSENCVVFRQNCGGLPNVTLVQSAIWDKRTLLEICDPDERGWMIQVRETTAETPDSLPAVTMADVIGMGGGTSAVIVKLDIEGTESKVFSSKDLGWLDSVQCLIIETHGPEAHSIVSKAMQERSFSCYSSGEKLIFHRSPSAEMAPKHLSC